MTRNTVSYFNQMSVLLLILTESGSNHWTIWPICYSTFLTCLYQIMFHARIFDQTWCPLTLPTHLLRSFHGSLWVHIEFIHSSVTVFACVIRDFWPTYCCVSAFSRGRCSRRSRRCTSSVTDPTWWTPEVCGTSNVTHGRSALPTLYRRFWRDRRVVSSVLLCLSNRSGVL